MIYHIISYEGALPIKFGMTPDQVKDILGQPRLIRTTQYGSLRYSYDDMFILFLRSNNTVNEMTFGSRARLYFEDLDVFGSPDAFSHLLRKDGQPYELNGSIVLLNLGMAISKYHGEPEEGVTVFARGVFDQLKDRFVEYHL